MPSDFRKRLREIRESKGVGLRELAGKMRVSPAYWSRLERGHEPPPKPERIKEAARIIGATTEELDELLALAGRIDPEVQRYIHKTPSLPEFLRTAKARKKGDDFYRAMIDRLKKDEEP